jgi:hypothetical protein
VSARLDLRRAAPWVLCAVSLGMLGLSSWLRWLTPGHFLSEDVDWVEATIGLVGFAGIPVVGALIASRQPANPYGWLWCATGLAYGVANVAEPLVEVVGGPVWVASVLTIWGYAILVGLLVLVFLLFPTGRPPTDRWRWVARAAVTGALLLMLMVALTSDPADPAAAAPWALQGTAGRYVSRAVVWGSYAMFGLVFVAMCSLVLRFRRAGPVERRQLSWFLYATVVNAAFLVLDQTLAVLPPNLITAVASAVGIALLPVAVGIAVLRYRLYEIDRIVSRTVSYGLLSAALIGLYLLVVALLRPLLEPLTGSSALAVAGSTLAVAAVFSPARRRLQAAVDRRFDRARYDAARAVDAFAARLRDQVDLDEITASLCETVAATVAPGRVAVWLRTPTGLQGSER